MYCRYEIISCFIKYKLSLRQAIKIKWLILNAVLSSQMINFFLGWYKFNSFIIVFSTESIYMDEKFMKWFSGKRMKLKICHFLNFLFWNSVLNEEYNPGGTEALRGTNSCSGHSEISSWGWIRHFPLMIFTFKVSYHSLILFLTISHKLN